MTTKLPTTPAKQSQSDTDIDPTDAEKTKTGLSPSMRANLNKYLRQGSIIFSTIDNKGPQLSPQLLRIKNNILLILLILASYGVYYLIGNFIDYLLLGYIAGLAYHQTRTRFTKLVKDPKSYQGRESLLSVRILKAMLLLLLIFVLPRLRYMLSNPEQFHNALFFPYYLKSFQKNTNITVIICQVLLGLVVLYVMLGPHLKKIGRKIRPTNIPCIKTTFCLFVLLVTISTVALIPAVLLKQLGEVGFYGEQKLEQFLDCQVITFGSHNNVSRSLCSDKVTENYVVKQTIEEFRNQNETVSQCKKFINKFQLDYIGYNFFHYDEIACAWYSIMAKAYNYSAIQSQTHQLSTTTIFTTGTSIFKHIFGNLTSLLTGLSNSIFYFTIWITTFILTVQMPSQYHTLQHIFSSENENKQQLLNDITKLIHATCLIVFWHFVVSILLLQLFDFTPVNLIISTLLALMAFVPLFRPWFGVLGVGVVRMVVMRQYVVTVGFILLYRHVSEKIYSFYYGKLKMHEIIVNFSVLFGIYSFGITGIIYGPLIVILYSTVFKELLMNQNGSGVVNSSAITQSEREIEYLRKKESQYRKEIKEDLQSRTEEEKEDPKYKEGPAIRVKFINKQGENQIN